MRKEIYVDKNDPNVLGKCLDFTEETLSEVGLKTRQINNAMLIIEECLPKMMEVAPEKCKVRIRVKKVFADTSVRVTIPGLRTIEFVPENISTQFIDEDNPETTAVISDLILKNFKNQVRYKYRNNINSVTVMASEAGKTFLYATMAALFLGIVVGILLRLFMANGPAGVLVDDVLDPITDIFMNALRMICGPSLFCSVVVCIAQFSGAREFGRIFRRLLAITCISTVVSVGIGMVLFYLTHPGQWGMNVTSNMINTIGVENIGTQEFDTTIPTVLELIKSIVPDNIVSPFLQTNTLQILFMSLVVGFAASAIGEKSSIIDPFIDAIDAIVTTITVAISRCMPLVAFCSIVSIIISNNGRVLLRYSK